MSISRSNLFAIISTLALTLSICAVFMHTFNNLDEKSLKRLPSNYMRLSSNLIYVTDRVFECRSQHSKDVADKSYYVGGVSPSFIAMGNSKCDDLERVASKQKVTVDDFFQSDSYKNLKNNQIDIDQAIKDRAAYIESMDKLDSALKDYERENSQYLIKKVEHTYINYKRSLGDFSRDAQIVARFKSMDIALEMGSYSAIMDSFGNLEALIMDRTLKELEKAENRSTAQVGQQ